MREPFDPPFLDQRQKRADIDSRRLEQDLPEASRSATGQAFLEVPAFLLNDAPDEREAVAVDARAGEAEDDIAGLDRVSRQHLVAFDRADAEAGKIVIAGGIHA